MLILDNVYNVNKTVEDLRRIKNFNVWSTMALMPRLRKDFNLSDIEVYYRVFIRMAERIGKSGITILDHDTEIAVNDFKRSRIEAIDSLNKILNEIHKYTNNFHPLYMQKLQLIESLERIYEDGVEDKKEKFLKEKLEELNRIYKDFVESKQLNSSFLTKAKAIHQIFTSEASFNGSEVLNDLNLYQKAYDELTVTFMLHHIDV